MPGPENPARSQWEAVVEIIDIRSCELEERHGEKYLRASVGALARKVEIPLADVRAALRYPNLLQVNHDNGIVRLRLSDRESHRRVIEALMDLPDADYRELDYPARVSGQISALISAVAFYLVITAVIFGVLYLFDDEEQPTQPLTYLLYLIPAVSIAYLARRGLTAAIEAVGERFGGKRNCDPT